MRVEKEELGYAEECGLVEVRRVIKQPLHCLDGRHEVR
jgi:hypothetical protein